MSAAAQGGRAKKAPTRAAKARAATEPATAAKKRATTTAAPARKAASPARKAASPARKAASPARGRTFEKVRAICLALPDTKLTMTWGSPHFRVGEKIFCGFGAEDGKEVMGVKLEMSHARSVVKDARFWPSPYVGKHGWVSMNVTLRESWDEVEALIRESYELIAPKSSLKKLR